MESANFLISKEIEIKEREANLLRIICRCRKIGIDISTDILKREIESQSIAAPQSKENIQQPSSGTITTENAPEDSFLKEPTLEEFGLTKECLEKYKYAVLMPTIPIRKAKPFTFFKPVRSPRYVEGSPYLSLRSNIGRDSYKNTNECTFDCTPEVCQMGKIKNILKVHDENSEPGSQTVSPLLVTPKMQNILPAVQPDYLKSDSFQAKKASLRSPKEPEYTYTMEKFASLSIYNKNEFLSSFQPPNNHTPEEPELHTTSLDMLEQGNAFNFQMPPSPKLSTTKW